MLKSKARSGRVFRSRSQLIGGIVGGIFFDGLAIGVLLGGRERTSAVIFGVAFFLICTWVFGRLAWAAVYTSEEGIHVLNIFSSFDLKWDEIQRFDIGRWKLLPYVCLIHLRDGDQTHAFGLQESTNFPNESAKKMIAELTEELASRRSGGPEDQQMETGPGSAQSELFHARGQ